MAMLIGGLAFAAGSVLFGYAGLRNLGKLFTGKTTPTDRAAVAFVGVIETIVAIAFTVALIALIEASIPD